MYIIYLLGFGENSTRIHESKYNKANNADS